MVSQKEINRQSSLLSQFENDCLAATPLSNRRLSEAFKQYEAYIMSQGYRVTISGIGGEEATGGSLPTPKPEFQDLLARARFFTLARQLKAWAGKMRKPPLPLLWEAVRGFFTRSPIYIGPTQDVHSTPWFQSGFVLRNRSALCGYPIRVKLFGALPSFQDHIHELNHTRRFLAFCHTYSEPLREVRYPYLDRDLLEFVYAIPREQLVRVGQRRSLMKRALVGIVPDDLLNRRKKASVPQQSPRNTSTRWPSFDEVGRSMVTSSLGIVDHNRLEEVLQKARRREEVPADMMKRTLFLESWVRHLTTRGVLMKSKPLEEQSCCSALEAEELQAPSLPKRSAS